MNPQKLSFATRVIHAGEPSPRIGGAISMPIFQSSTYESSRAPGYHDIPYLRLNNSPNHLALHAKLASLEGAESALVTASGMAAISTALLSFLKAGDHLLAQTGLYGGTHACLCHDLPALGIEVDFVDLNRPADWADKVRDTSRAFYVESMTNPLLQVGDLPAAVAFARQHGLLTVIDNTLPSPVNFRPLEHGFDLVVHSGTKYLNGHSDIVAGAIIGRQQQIAEVKLKLDHLGGTLDPHACFLLHRGIKTLPLRVNQQNTSAMALATVLAAHANVNRVHYPGLASHPEHARARALFSGYGGLLSFEHAGGADGAHALIDRLELAVEAVSLGGVETLVTLPAESSHAGVAPEQRAAAGIVDGLVRVAVGVEGAQDLIDDFQQALDG